MKLKQVKNECSWSLYTDDAVLAVLVCYTRVFYQISCHPLYLAPV
jgi:hypothetical protein